MVLPQVDHKVAEELGVLRVETERINVTRSPFSQVLRTQTGGLTSQVRIYEEKV